ncbi:MAG: MBL fold metallo-hydrolase [Candidatus Hodarchaeota archaeon]
MVVDFKLEEASSHVIANVDGTGWGNVAGIALRNYTVAVDSTVFPNLGSIFRQKLEKRFDLPTKFLLITHYHGDHANGTQAFEDITIISHEETFLQRKSSAEERWSSPDYIENWKKELGELASLVGEFRVVYPNITFKNHLKIIDNDLSLEFIHAGGHTSGSSYVLFPSEKVLISGDLIFAKEFPYSADPSCNPEIWIKTLKHILELDFQYLVPGHGPVVDKSEVKTCLEIFEKFKGEICAGIAEGKQLSEISLPELFKEPKQYYNQDALAHWFNFYKKQQVGKDVNLE